MFENEFEKISSNIPFERKSYPITVERTVQIDGKYVIKFPVKTTINSSLSIDNFPVLGKGYTVEVYTSDDAFKSVLDYYGSKNIIKIKKDGNVEQEYLIIVNGDVNGDGKINITESINSQSLSI